MSPTDKVIGNLLRVVQNGREIKAAVDRAVSECGEVHDLVDSIEAARKDAEAAGEDDARRRDAALRSGLQGPFLYGPFSSCL